MGIACLCLSHHVSLLYSCSILVHSLDKHCKMKILLVLMLAMMVIGGPARDSSEEDSAESVESSESSESVESAESGETSAREFNMNLLEQFFRKQNLFA